VQIDDRRFNDIGHINILEINGTMLIEKTTAQIVRSEMNMCLVCSIASTMNYCK
jgi:hypothetical protein